MNLVSTTRKKKTEVELAWAHQGLIKIYALERHNGRQKGKGKEETEEESSTEQNAGEEMFQVMKKRCQKKRYACVETEMQKL